MRLQSEIVSLIALIRYCDESSVTHVYALHSGNWLIPQSLTEVGGEATYLLSVPLFSYLLNTSTAGLVLIGASATPQNFVSDAAQSFPLALRNFANASIVSLLGRLNVSAADVQHVLLWSLERDCTGQLSELPNATVYTTAREFSFARSPNATERCERV